MDRLSLLPIPRHIDAAAGQHQLRAGRRIALLGIEPAALLFNSAVSLQAALDRHAGVLWEFVSSDAGPYDEIGAVLRIDPDQVAHDQGYELTIDPAPIVVAARPPAGIYYGVCTLRQILQKSGGALTCFQIRDWPHLTGRVVMLEVSRDKVPTMKTVYALVDMLAAWKINQLQL